MLGAAAVLGMAADDSQAQEEARPPFDRDRLWYADSTIFAPFRVTDSEPLRAALAAGRLADETGVLVLEHPAGRLALVTDQMAYHHVAQGELAGEPWLVSF